MFEHINKKELGKSVLDSKNKMRLIKHKGHIVFEDEHSDKDFRKEILGY